MQCGKLCFRYLIVLKKMPAPKGRDTARSLGFPPIDVQPDSGL
jgi:hypothetical protein